MASFPYSSVLITGSNRGLGLTMIKHILQSARVPKHIFATCRSLKNAEELQSLAETNSNVHVLEFDMSEVSGPRLNELVKQVSDIVPDSGLNVLINNAGINLKDSFESTTTEAMHKVLEVNTIAPFMITRAFRPLLKLAGNVKGDQPNAVVVNISSLLGSMESTRNAGYVSYKVSKAALNMVTRCISGEFAADGISVISVHPGWVQTDMGGKNAHLTTDQSAGHVLKVVSCLQKSQTGSFFNYDGTILQW